LSDEINVAHKAWLKIKINLAYLTSALAVLLAGVILARLRSKWADLALTSNTRIEPTVAKFLNNIIRFAPWAVVGFVGTEAYAKFLLRGDMIE
jgi:small conductance mechanosensitive channel